MKKIVIIISTSVIIFVLGLYLYMKQYYLFMPWEYETGDALYQEWYEYHGEIEMYMCSHLYETDDERYYCAHITDEEIIKNVLLEYMAVSNETHSRLEVEEANFPDDFGDRVVIEISRVDSRDEDGVRDEGTNLFIGYIYENTTWANSYKGLYYYYHVTDDLYDFVMNYTDENIN